MYLHFMKKLKVSLSLITLRIKKANADQRSMTGHCFLSFDGWPAARRVSGQ